MVEKYRPFSTRQGLVPRQVIQVDSMTERLRNRLYSQLTSGSFSLKLSDRELQRKIVDGFFGQRSDQTLRFDVEAVISQHFAKADWNLVYDFLEFIGAAARTSGAAYNTVLEEEGAAYRFVGGKVIPLTSDTEIAAIEEALKHPIQTARTHIADALGQLAVRPHPDYASVVGEAIQAVEAVVRVLTVDASVTLGEGLKKLRGTEVHPALLKSYSHLYGWSSDEGGARHAFKGEPIDAATAKYVLVSCSAFIGYLTEVAASPRRS